jgi:DNA-binding NarL/FixJ family response regulator
MNNVMAESIRILCVDDHPVMRDGIAYALQTQPDMQLVGEAANGEDAVKLFRQLRPDITLMDLQLPGMNGIKTIEVIRESFPKASEKAIHTFPISSSAIAPRVLPGLPNFYFV